MPPGLKDLERRIEAAKLKHGLNSSTLATARQLRQMREFQEAIAATAPALQAAAAVMEEACKRTAKALSEGPAIRISCGIFLPNQHL
ncbi:hypothetical protein J4729_07530 [Leisingera sp. HS039]|uniref:hypothetical protein n=1 Tax=Leisingera sp. HS039 TaxID=2818496 RepID=UPI001B3A6053|nr:hypothetical protein [Leisingera sp. HS039]MBQ4824400.1 hypothetical protein [Leisingera sp. HS039]